RRREKEDGGRTAERPRLSAAGRLECAAAPGSRRTGTGDRRTGRQAGHRSRYRRPFTTAIAGHALVAWLHRYPAGRTDPLQSAGGPRSGAAIIRVAASKQIAKVSPHRPPKNNGQGAARPPWHTRCYSRLPIPG